MKRLKEREKSYALKNWEVRVLVTSPCGQKSERSLMCVIYRIKHKDGKRKRVNELYPKIPGTDGKPDKYQGAVYDVTDNYHEALYQEKNSKPEFCSIYSESS